MKTAVVLFNLGGPDNPSAVRPFLFNLFADPAIIRVPALLRYPLAWLISKRRERKAQNIYAKMGGGSPILPNTQAQANALEAALGPDFKVFIAMRYWQPRAIETALQVKDYNPNSIILLPLYPQYSTTTSASSVDEWQTMVRHIGLGHVPSTTVCCYPTDNTFITAQAARVKTEIEKAKHYGRPRILFSAHGLPEKVVAAGDPYQWQCEQTAQALARVLGDGFDWLNTYQSRVGPLKWIGPATEDEIKHAGADRVPLVVVPMAFVSEHSETLVELDIDYKELAAQVGVPHYGRAPTVMADPTFIDGLAAQVRKAMKNGKKLCSQDGGRICPKHFSGCPHEL